LVFQGPYPCTESLWQEVEPSKQKLHRHPVSLECHPHPSGVVRFPQPWLPAPWHTMWGLSFFSALEYRERWYLLNYLEKIWEGEAELPTCLDLQTAESWLTQLGQTALIQKNFWNPLCRFLLGTSLGQTQAGGFTAIMKQVFFQSRQYRPFIFESMTFSESLRKSLWHGLHQRGVSVESPADIEYIQVDSEQVSGVRASDGTVYTGDWYVAALHPTRLTSLLPERWLSRFSSFHHIGQTPSIPRVLFHAFSDHQTKSPRILLQDSPFSWTLCRSTFLPHGPATLLSSVATGDSTVLSWSDEHIKSCACKNLHTFFPFQQSVNIESLPYRIIRQPLGFIPQIPGIGPTPLSNQSPIRNFLLSGCWTDTRAITEMESSIASGESCASVVVKQYQRAV